MGITTLLFERGIAELLNATTSASWVLFARRSPRGFDVVIWKDGVFERHEAESVSVEDQRLKISPRLVDPEGCVGFQILKNPVWDILALDVSPENAPQIAVSVDRLFQLAMETSELPQLTPIDHASDVLERIQDAFYALDEDFRFVWVNAAGERLARLSRREMMGKRPWETHPEVAGTNLEQIYRDAMKDGQSRVLKYFMENEGEWVEGRVFPSPQGIAAYYTIFTETHRQSMKQELMEVVATGVQPAETPREILEAGVKAIHDQLDWDFGGVWLSGPQGVGSSALWASDTELAETMSQTVASMEDLPVTLLQGKYGFKALVLIRLHLDDYQKCILAFGRTNNDWTLWTRVLTDARESLEIIFQRRFARLHMDRIFRFTPDCLAVLDSTERFIRVNPTLEFLLGYTGKSLRTMCFRDLVHPDDIEDVAEEFEGVLTNDTLIAFEARMRTVHGLWRWISWSCHPMSDEQVLFLSGRDITEQKSAEDAVISQTRKLREREQRLRTISNLTNDAFWDWNIEQNKIWWPAEDAEYGQPRTIEDWFSLVHVEDLPHVKAVLLSIGERENSECTLTFRYKRVDGHWASVRARAISKINSVTGEMHVYGGFNDITSELEFNERIRISEERFRLISLASQDMIFEWDLEENAIWWSEDLDQSFGDMSTIELWQQRVHPDDIDRVSKSLSHAILTKDRAWQEEYRLKRQNDTWAFVTVTGRVVLNADGIPVKMVGGVIDVSEKRDQMLRLQEQAQLIEQASSAISVRDLAGIVHLWNQAAAQIYGVQQSDIVGKHLSNFVNFDPMVFTEAVRATLEKGSWEGEFHVLLNGVPKVITARWSLLIQEHAKKIVAFESDSTQTKLLESQYIRAQRLESVGRLAAGIAHDLNNVLSPLLVGLGTLKRDEDSDSKLKLLNTLEGTTLRGRDIIRQLLGYARGEEVEMKLLDLQLLTQDFVGLASDTLPKAIRLESDLNSADAWVVGDRTQIGQVLMNMCVNAADAMSEGGTIKVELRNVRLDHHMASTLSQAVSGEYARISISDTGHGISPEEREHLFEPFYTTKPVGKGTGLGLPMALTIVKKHGGFINLYSEKGRGTTFHVYLPLANDRPSDVDITSTPDILHGGGETILVVDDDSAIRNIVCDALEAFNYKTLRAAHGAEAVSIFAEKLDTVALILTDLHMPVMDGLALIAAARHLNPDIKVVALSGLSANGKRAKASASGIRHFLTKPFATEELLQTLQEALDE